MVVKVKEPQPAERAQLREGQVLYTYLHLAPDPEQTADLVKSGVTAIAYETVTGPGGTLPLLKPMSQVAGRMSIQAGATALEKAHGGRGVLLGGVPGVMPGTVVVIGGGVVGFNAAQMAVGLGADVTILDRDPEVLERLGIHFESRAKTRFSNEANLAEMVCAGRPGDRRGAGARRRGAQAGHARDARLHEARRGAGRRGDRPGRLLRDQPSRPRTTTRPTWSTASSTTASPTCPARSRAPAPTRSTTSPCRARCKIADLGWKQAMRFDPHLAAGLNVHAGQVTYPAVASELGYELLRGRGSDHGVRNGAETSAGTRISRPVARSIIAQVVLALTTALPPASVKVKCRSNRAPLGPSLISVTPSTLSPSPILPR